MKNEIKKTGSSVGKTGNALSHSLHNINVGDVFIKVESEYNPEVIKVVDINEKGFYYRSADDWEATVWNEYEHFHSFADWDRYKTRYSKVEGGSFKELWNEAAKILSGEISIDFYKDQSTDSLNTENALMSRSSKEGLLALQNAMEKKKDRVELIKTFVMYEMERKKWELNKIKDSLYGVISEFKNKISKIMRVITTIELYLGINEELFQIQDGQKAPADEPIQFRQQVLYMDEEIGHYKDGGLDFNDIKWFDEWLIENNNYSTLIPERKGVVVFRPRRYDKEYDGYDPIKIAAYNRLNSLTYLLIRNGECLYRVFTENITIYPRLFPQRKELQDLLASLNDETEKDIFWNEKKEREAAEDLIYQYKKRAILMQGLIDRTEVFHPIAKRVSMFHMEQSDGLINFIYDDELTLPSGRLPFWEWVKEQNKKIEHGSRIIFTGFDWGERNCFHKRLYGHYRYNERNAPDPPCQGVYQVEHFSVPKTLKLCETQFRQAEEYWNRNKVKFEVVETEKSSRYGAGYDGHECEDFPLNDPIKTDEKRITVKVGDYKDLTIMYNPGDTVYGSWGDYDPHERKNRIRMRISKTDSEVLNYDQIGLDDIDFYLNSRVDRPNYLYMMPLLQAMKQWRIKEMQGEIAFSELVYGRNIKHFSSESILRKRISDSIDWWKFKNQWKRPIEKDDELALRMIEKRINSKNYNNLKNNNTWNFSAPS